MRLNMVSSKMPDPNATTALITGTELTKLRTLSVPYWGGQRILTPRWNTTTDSDSIAIQSYSQLAPTKINGSTPAISFVDAGRFIRELTGEASLSSVMPPCLPSMIIHPGYSIATAWPLGTEMLSTTVVARDHLESLGFEVPASKFYDVHFHLYSMADLSFAAVLGPSASDIFFIAQQFAAYGYGETMIELMQINALNRNLTKFSSQAGIQTQILPDEFSALENIMFDLIPAFQAGERSIADYVKIASGLSMLGRCEILDPSMDTTGLSVQLYYAMLNPDYVHNLTPAHVIALCKCDNITGIGTVSMPSPTVVGGYNQVRIKMVEQFLPHVELLSTLTEADLDALQTLRYLYKACLIVRFLQYKNYALSLSTTIRGTDRESFFAHLL